MLIPQKELIKIASGELTSSYYDLDDILRMICSLGSDDVNYDVLTHRLFEGERGYMGMPDGWYCHIITWEFDSDKNEFIKNRDKSIKIFGSYSPKDAVIKALRIMFELDGGQNE